MVAAEYLVFEHHAIVSAGAVTRMFIGRKIDEKSNLKIEVKVYGNQKKSLSLIKYFFSILLMNF